MARIPLRDPAEHEDPDVRALLEWVEQAEGRIPNHFKIELHFPENFAPWLTWVRALWTQGELSFDEVQQVGIAVSRANLAPYCVGSFAAVWERAGSREAAEVEAYVRDGEQTLSGRARAIVDFALLANRDPHAVTQEHINDLRSVGLTDGGILQVVWLVNMFTSSNRITTLFDVDFDDENAFQKLAAMP